MVELVTVAVVIVGALFLFFGSTFSSWGVSALGLFVGGCLGYLLGPTAAGALGVSSLAGAVVAALGGAVLGLVLSYFLLSMAVAAIAFVLGSYVGWTVIAGYVLEDGGLLLEVVVALAVGLIAGAIGMVLTKTMMVILTAFLGAAMASMSVTATDVRTAAESFTPEPLLLDVTAPLFLGLLILGILTQFGLFKFGYVTKLLAKLPGVRPVRNRKSRG